MSSYKIKSFYFPTSSQGLIPKHNVIRQIQRDCLLVKKKKEIICETQIYISILNNLNLGNLIIFPRINRMADTQQNQIKSQITKGKIILKILVSAQNVVMILAGNFFNYESQLQMAIGGGVCLVFAWVCFITFIFLMVSKCCRMEFADMKFRGISNSRIAYEVINFISSFFYVGFTLLVVRTTIYTRLYFILAHICLGISCLLTIFKIIIFPEQPFNHQYSQTNFRSLELKQIYTVSYKNRFLEREDLKYRLEKEKKQRRLEKIASNESAALTESVIIL